MYISCTRSIDKGHRFLDSKEINTIVTIKFALCCSMNPFNPRLIMRKINRRPSVKKKTNSVTLTF